MNILVILFPLALGLGLAGLAGFFWCMRTGQYNDLEGSGWRVLQDDDLVDDQSPHVNAMPQPERALGESARRQPGIITTGSP